MTKKIRMPVFVPHYMAWHGIEKNFENLQKTNWTSLYCFPLFLGDELYEPKAEDLNPTPVDLDAMVVPCNDQKPLRPLPLHVGEITGFFLERHRIYIEVEITHEKIDIEHPGWEAKLYWSPRLNNPRDTVTHVRLEKLGGNIGDIHALDREIMESAHEPA